ncbi:hypothetical protein SPRG_06624 [Saprolegnia parasitica CBS 223.65]|uniref:Uncharacterized protein n=1 Tax=Saprolegnia parasitica (strain CBS 223.65) TaxID=695850 RepID=A0A067CPC8_SAPPC|nr:hypothetical protein SPRG_06624 [Saprolegnia parasitica CBS 223.65]KDO28386.1 hypothetical protein SPRG_06624 [Saprolegnia parasitica CBS 223.65]|eukprot:XP_012200828.1 hypothetical protein SPRG_06624 [Saprolegnia parasitica CBS 223.65]
MKAKWTARDGLQKRWDQLSKKIPTKTVAQIEAFFTAIVAHVRSLLMFGQVAMDANQPDEVRLALICWYRLFASSPMSGADLENPSQKRAIVHRLTTSFLKSRKQMIAAKSAKKKTAKELASPGAATTVPLTTTTTPVHHPLVRKKRALPLPTVETPEKRVRHVPSRESSPASSPTPVRAASVASPAYVYDLTTPSKKRQIKVRLVPIDKRTQAAVSQTGAMPKVELKMSSSKRISDVCDHMMKKWAAVLPLLPARSTLRVVPLGDRLHPGWGTHDISVTCLDIFSHCRQIAADGLVDTVTLEYRWEMEVNDENASPSFVTPNKTEYLTPQRVKLPRPTNLTVEKPIPVPLDLDFLPSPHEVPVRDPHDPQVTLNFSTDFNGFLDEGPGACSALMDSLGVPPSVATPRKPTKRITPTLVTPLLRLEMPPPSVV